MPSSDDDLIRNGTLKELLFYYDVKIGNKTYRAWMVVGALMLVSGIIGGIVG